MGESILQKFWKYVLIATIISCCGYLHNFDGFLLVDPSGTPVSSTTDYPQVVMVYTGSACTGVIVDHDLVLTAGHCRSYKDSYSVFDQTGPKLGTTSDRIAPPDDDPDIALLRFPPNTFTIPPLTIGPEVVQNDLVELVGFGCNDAKEQTGQLIKRRATNHVLNVFDFITLYTPLSSSGKMIVGSDNTAGICSGDSGGPLLKNGQVVGISSISEVRTDRVYSWFVNLSHPKAREFLGQYLKNSNP